MRCTNVNRTDNETISKVLYDKILLKLGENDLSYGAFVLICMPNSTILEWTSWYRSSNDVKAGLCKMCVFYFYHFFMITAIVCMYVQYVCVRIKLYVHFILSFKTDCNFILGWQRKYGLNYGHLRYATCMCTFWTTNCVMISIHIIGE